MTIARVIRHQGGGSSGGGGNSVLEQAAAGLSPGDSVTIAGVTWAGGDIPVGSGDNDFSWINKGWFDAVRRRFGFAVKQASPGDTEMKHCVYSFDDNTVHCENCGFDQQGHVYDFIGYDPDDGVVYLTPGGGQDSFLYAATPSDTHPGNPTSTGKDANDEIASIMYAGNDWFVSGEGSCEWHPNLFSTEGGLIIVCKRGLAAWRKSTNVFSVIITAGTFDNPDVPAVVYCEDEDAAYVCINTPADGGSTATYKVTRNNSFAEIGTQPISFGPDRGTPATACLVKSPNTGKPYAIEKVPGGRVWRPDDDDEWEEQVYSHPATAQGDSEDFLGIACRGLRQGAGPDPILFVQRRTTGNPADLVLWLPPDA